MTAAPPTGAARRGVLVRLGALAAAIAIGLALQGVVRGELAALEKRAETDVIAARAELAGWLRVGGALLFGLTGAIGVSIVLSSRRSLREERFPAPGVWSWGGARAVTGPAARRFASVGLALGTLLVVCSALAGGLTWYMAATLLACRAL